MKFKCSCISWNSLCYIRRSKIKDKYFNFNRRKEFTIYQNIFKASLCLMKTFHTFYSFSFNYIQPNTFPMKARFLKTVSWTQNMWLLMFCAVCSSDALLIIRYSFFFICLFQTIYILRTSYIW